MSGVYFSDPPDFQGSAPEQQDAPDYELAWLLEQQDWDFFREIGSSVFAKHLAETDEYTVVDLTGAATTMPAAEFNAKYAPTPPSKFPL